MRPSLAAVTLLLALTAIAGCGQSASDKAMADVCSARASLQKQVDQLQALTPTTATTTAVKDGLQSIAGDLSTIRSAQGKLSDKRRSDVKTATTQFTAQVATLAGTVGRTVSVQGAADELQQGLQQLGASYRSSFSRVDCSS